MKKYIDAKEFREEGYLQEVNRRFFHPLGLALEIIQNKETEEYQFNGIADYRDDPEGVFFGSFDSEKVKHIDNLLLEKIKIRKDLGFSDENGIQTI